MARSLEASLVVPISLTVILGLASQAWPLFSQSGQLARIITDRQSQRLSLDRTYHLDDRGVLLTSPQHVVEWIETARQLGAMPSASSNAAPQ
jgi:hypothetical protein